MDSNKGNKSKDFNKDENVPPAWINSAFFETVLKHSENDPALNVAEYRIMPATEAGNHFSSVIFRANVDYRSRGTVREISLIIKTVPDEDGLKRSLYKDGVLYETETTMYNKVIPQMHRLFRSVGYDTELSPSLIYSSKKPEFVMVFEDISTRGYVMKDSQLDLNEAKIVYRKLARWHAASVHLASTVPAIKKLNKGLCAIAHPYEPGWTNNIAELAKVCQEWPGYENYSEKMDNLRENLYPKIVEIFQYKESSIYNVLNHGDFQYKNMMLKIVDGTTQDILLLDFQISVWGSPAIDIIYSLYNMCSTETRDNYRDELIKFYYDEFVTSLNKFGHLGNIPSLLDLHVEILKCGHLETFLASVFLPFMVSTFEEIIEENGNSTDQGIELFKYENEEKMQQAVLVRLRRPRYAAIIQRYLPKYLHKGLLDV